MPRKLKPAALLAASWWGARLNPNHADKRAAVEAAIASVVDSHLRANRGFRVHLECDYEPKGLLDEALRSAGFEGVPLLDMWRGKVFPEKHDLDVYEDRLCPKEGYGNWTREIAVKGRPILKTEG